MHVLDGCKNTIKTYKHVIILSVHPTQISKINQNPNDIKILATQNNYNIKKIVDKFNFINFDKFELAEYILEPTLTH